MNEETGWIKLHRKIINHWIFERQDYLKAWLTILLEVNYYPNKTEIKGQILDCDRGQKLYSIDTWTKKFGREWTPEKTRHFFKLLKDDNMVETQGLKYTTKLTVLNYDIYQEDTHTEPKLNPNSTQTETKLKQTIKEEEKKEKKEKNKSENKDFEILWKQYPLKAGKGAALKHFNISVKTAEDLINIDKALTNYKVHLNINDWKHPQNGSTWFNNWRDWIEWEEPVKDDKKYVRME